MKTSLFFVPHGTIFYKPNTFIFYPEYWNQIFWYLLLIKRKIINLLVLYTGYVKNYEIFLIKTILN